jgi:hypothetical protein
MLEDEGEVQEMKDDQLRWLKELQDIRWDHHEKIYLLNIHTAKHAQLWYELESYFFIPVDSEKNPTEDAAKDGTEELLEKLVKQGWKADENID